MDEGNYITIVCVPLQKMESVLVTEKEKYYYYYYYSRGVKIRLLLFFIYLFINFFWVYKY